MQKKSVLFGLVAVVLTGSALLGGIACNDDDDTPNGATPDATDAGDATDAPTEADATDAPTEPAGDATDAPTAE